MTDPEIKKISQLLDEKITPIQKELEQHGKLLESHGKLLSSLKKDQRVMMSMLDKEQMQQRKRLKRVEEHIGLHSATS